MKPIRYLLLVQNGLYQGQGDGQGGDAKHPRLDFGFDEAGEGKQGEERCQ